MMKDTDTRCIICGGSDYRVYRHISSRLNDIPLGLVRGNFVEASILKCTKCGLLRSHQEGENREKMTQIYHESINLEQAISKISHDYSSVYTFDELDWLGEPNGESVLEIGCSAGYFLVRARARGWNTYGIDIDGNAIEYAQENYNLEVTCGSVSESSYPPDFFKAIILIGVLEHIPDPVSFMNIVQRFLRPDGVVMLAVPNASSLNGKISRLSRHDWDMFCEPGHLYHFNIKTLSLLAERCGLVVSEWRTATIKIRGKVPFLPVRIPRLEHLIQTLCKKNVLFRIIYEASLRLLDYVKLGDILAVKFVKR